jgi:hypothetical protein
MNLLLGSFARVFLAQNQIYRSAFIKDCFSIETINAACTTQHGFRLMARGQSDATTVFGITDHVSAPQRHSPQNRHSNLLWCRIKQKAIPFDNDTRRPGVD